MRAEQEPTLSEKASYTPGETRNIYEHPAFGTVTMSVVSGGDSTLFGSDLGHSQRVCIRVNGAELQRDLHRDWIHGKSQFIEFEMSHAQFAQFITSNGNGSGTPCTLKWVRGVGDLPSIKSLESKHELTRREIHAQAEKGMDHLREHVKKLGELIDSGAGGKKAMRELHRSMQSAAGNLPGNLAFAVESAEEALEKATSDAKIEVEAYITTTAQRLGLQSISQLAQLGHEAKS